jgi:hypothetical protein
MKNTILVFSLILAASGASAQSYPGVALQNSSGNYARIVPSAPVTICEVTDTAVPCTIKAPTYTNQTRSLACTLSNNAIGAPTSGTNCNNPGVADANGNWVVFLAPGNYKACVYAQNYQCWTFSVPNTSAAATLTLQTNGTPNGSQTLLNLTAGAGVTLVDNGSGAVTISSTSTGSSTAFADPTTRFFGRTNIDLLNNGAQSGDPQVVWDSANSQWVMIWYEAIAGVVSTWKATATSLNGPWSGSTQLTSLNSYHKTRVLVDVSNNPIQLGGFFYAISVFYNGTLGSKQIYLFRQATLQGNSWAIQNSGNPVVAKAGAGGAGVYDDFFTDSPEFVYDAGTGNCYIWYTGAPSVSQADFGFAERVLESIATSVTGTYVKQAGYVMGPSSVGGTWDFGMVEGVQVRAKADGTLFIAYIGGSTRPVSPGDELSTTLWGFASAPSLSGAWTKVAGPFIQLTGLPQWPTGVPNSGSVGTIVDSTDIWRPYCVLDPITNKWYVFYNTGNGGSPVEKITYARQGVLSFSNGAYVGGLPVITNGGVILVLTTSELQIPGSQVFLRPGRYLVKYQVVEQDVGGTTPKLNGALFIRPNGTKAGQWSQSFFGSYAFEGDDYEVEDIVNISAPAGSADNSQYVDSSLQILSGTPTANTFARNLRVLIEQIN